MDQSRTSWPQENVISSSSQSDVVQHQMLVFRIAQHHKAQPSKAFPWQTVELSSLHKLSNTEPHSTKKSQQKTRETERECERERERERESARDIGRLQGRERERGREREGGAPFSGGRCSTASAGRLLFERPFRACRGHLFSAQTILRILLSSLSSGQLRRATGPRKSLGFRRA